MNYYNDNDPNIAAWLRKLILDGLIPSGDVDERSITDVQPKDLKGYSQCHFFAGIGGWPLALQYAGLSGQPGIWTGSCPCQPFSVAGLGKGSDDKRHLWPEFARLICECEPAIVFGEQVASKLGREWLSGVRLDLEAMGYAVGASDLCAASIGAPHIRQRLWWVADLRREGLEGWRRTELPECKAKRTIRKSMLIDYSESIWWPCRDGKWRRVPGWVDDAKEFGPQRLSHPGEGRGKFNEPSRKGGLSDSETSIRRAVREKGHKQGRIAETGGSCGNVQNAEHDWMEVESRFLDVVNGLSAFLDNKRLEKHIKAKTPLQRIFRSILEITQGMITMFPLCGIVPGRVGLLMGAGNAIHPQVAAEFIKAFVDVVNGK